MLDLIRSALAALEPSRKEDWTKGGLPAVEAVRALVGPDVTRELIDAAAPGFTREHPVIDAEPPASSEASASLAAVATPPSPETRDEAVDIAVARERGEQLDDEPATDSEPEDRLAILNSELAALKQQQQQATRLEHARSDLSRVEKALVNLEAEIAKVAPRATPAQEYQRYVAACVQQRAERAEAARLAPARPVRSKLDQRIAAQNRAARRGGSR